LADAFAGNAADILRSAKPIEERLKEFC